MTHLITSVCCAKQASMKVLAAASMLMLGSVFFGSLRAESPDATAEGFGRLLDAVVRLDVWEAVYDDGTKRIAHGVGSGVIMDAEGHVLTNAHVANPYAERIRVTLANLERVEATLVGWDHWTDLAVIKLDMEDLEERGLSFQFAEFKDSSVLEPGDKVLAVGTPNGLTRTVTAGIISNTQRYFQGTHGDRGYETGHFNTWLQTDAAINPGNSGGPLVTPDGGVVGINTRGYLGADNLGFAVPSVIAREVMFGLIEKGSITRSYVGIEPAPLQDLEGFFELDINQGMLIQSVDPGSPAAEAELRPNDIVLSVDGVPVDGRFPEQLPPILHNIAQREVGSEVSLQVKRGDETLDFTLVTEQLESRVGEEYAFEDWGLSVQNLSKPIAREKQLDSDDGVQVVGVQGAFPAGQAGLMRGDIITKVNRQPLANLEELKELYAKWQENPDKVLFEVSHQHQVSFKVLKPR